MEDKHLASAVSILKKIHYLTLATVCEDGSPWNSPVSFSYDSKLTFSWGSSAENIHSENIRRDGRAFVVIYDSMAPEGTGEGMYMQGVAAELENENESIKKYHFVPSRIWINDEEKNADGSYRHDVRIELDGNKLRELL
jgi:hypothetical protein